MTPAGSGPCCRRLDTPSSATAGARGPHRRRHDRRLRPALRLLGLCGALLSRSHAGAAPARPADGRHSYSLSTFDAAGRLAQVRFAQAAAGRGTPLAAVATDRGLFLAAPEALPSPLLRQDGTARFATVTTEIVATHSGLSADGRALVAAAQRLAVEHAHTFDEEMPVELFLQEMSLLFQEYTIKPAARPFGATLLVGYCPRRRRPGDGNDRAPRLYRLDPSGGITQERYMVLNEVLERTGLPEALSRIADGPSDDDAVEEKLVRALQASIDALKEKQKSSATDDDEALFDPVDCILSASLVANGTLRVVRHDLVANDNDP